MVYLLLSIFKVFSITSENFLSLSDLEGNLFSFFAIKLTGIAIKQEFGILSVGILSMIFLISSSKG